MPPAAAALTGSGLRRARRAAREIGRRAHGRRHEVTWYHRADDPHSHLLAQVLPRFLELYDVDLVGRTVPHPHEGAISNPARWAGWAAADVQSIAPHYGLTAAGGHYPSLQHATATLLAAENADYLNVALEVGRHVTSEEEQGDDAPDADHLAANAAALRSAGHYLSGMLHYEGEWYWGIDRLSLLESRLEELGVGEGHAAPRELVPIETSHAEVLEMWVSVRSPYSYLAFDRVVALANEVGVDLRVKLVLPMVRRGIPAPRAKRLYILHDVARLAREQGVPFGWLVDPLPAVDRVLAAAWVARRHGREIELISSALRGMWAEGVDASTDRGLARIVGAAGVPMEETSAALRSGAWKEDVETHRESLSGAGLWGVPSFRFGEFVTWGQDRVWLLEHHLRASTQ